MIQAIHLLSGLWLRWTGPGGAGPRYAGPAARRLGRTVALRRRARRPNPAQQLAGKADAAVRTDVAGSIQPQMRCVGLSNTGGPMPTLLICAAASITALSQAWLVVRRTGDGGRKVWTLDRADRGLFGAVTRTGCRSGAAEAGRAAGRRLGAQARRLSDGRIPPESWSRVGPPYGRDFPRPILAGEPLQSMRNS
jgi:hypothetical protein